VTTFNFEIISQYVRGIVRSACI